MLYCLELFCELLSDTRGYYVTMSIMVQFDTYLWLHRHCENRNHPILLALIVLFCLVVCF